MTRVPTIHAFLAAAILLGSANFAPVLAEGDGPQTEGFPRRDRGAVSARESPAPRPVTPQIGDARYRYICSNPAGYYPEVTACAVPWRAVPR